MDDVGKKHLVITVIQNSGDTKSYYEGEHDPDDSPHKFSWRGGAENALFVPLWFDSEDAARQYMETAAARGTYREFFLIQEFTYHTQLLKSHALKNEARIIFSCKSDSWPVLSEGETRSFADVWAHVRSLFICDKEAAEDYVRRFNLDSTAAYNTDCKQ